MTKITDLLTRYDIDTATLEYLDRQISIPVLTAPQIQGDVSILPVTTAKASTPIPQAGVPVVRGENGGNTHSLHGSGFFDFAPSGAGMTIGTLTVAEGNEIHMHHPEHGFMGIGPGTYRIGSQREWRGEWARVAD